MRQKHYQQFQVICLAPCKQHEWTEELKTHYLSDFYIQRGMLDLFCVLSLLRPYGGIPAFPMSDAIESFLWLC